MRYLICMSIDNKEIMDEFMEGSLIEGEYPTPEEVKEHLLGDSPEGVYIKVYRDTTAEAVFNHLPVEDVG